MIRNPWLGIQKYCVWSTVGWVPVCKTSQIWRANFIYLKIRVWVTCITQTHVVQGVTTSVSQVELMVRGWGGTGVTTFHGVVTQLVLAMLSPRTGAPYSCAGLEFGVAERCLQPGGGWLRPRKSSLAARQWIPSSGFDLNIVHTSGYVSGSGSPVCMRCLCEHAVTWSESGLALPTPGSHSSTRSVVFVHPSPNKGITS